MTLKHITNAVEIANKFIKLEPKKYFLLIQFPKGSDDYLSTEPYVYSVHQADEYLENIYKEYKGEYLRKSLIYDIAIFCPTGARIKMIPLTLPGHYNNPCALECKKEFKSKEKNDPEMK